MSDSIRVIIADDSPFICRLLKQYLESDSAIRVVKTVHNGKDAVEAVKTLRPNVLTLDLDMPVLDGIGALKQIIAECPTAVLLVSGVGREGARMTEQGLAIGAVDFIFKYSPDAQIPKSTLRRELIAKVKSAARVKVIRSIPSRLKSAKQESASEERKAILPRPTAIGSRLVVVGASTGGPLALKEMLFALDPKFDFPMIIVQHMPERFTAILANQFERIFPFPIREAVHGEMIIPGTVLIVPGNRHLLIGSNQSVQISNAAEVNGHRPSIDVTMQSAAQIFGSQTTGVILSGMGNDGAEGLRAIYGCAGMTFAQSAETCVVDSMPVSAIQLGVVQHIGTPAEIGKWLTEKSGKRIIPKSKVKA
ncbi:MAG: chemotaxis-specific protein-glutamate methyltransferase CheB [Desulfobacteraceae bacterium]|nr:chemotaxis-specific protein-glutamate methyltransferase CheB [Desulfobacteraceae bacterium]